MVNQIYGSSGSLWFPRRHSVTQLCRLYTQKYIHFTKRTLLIVGIILSLSAAEGYLMQQKNRQAVAAMAISAAALVGIASHEAFRSTTYKDSGGIPTLGYGETKGVVAGQTTTPERALKKLLESADEHAQEMNKCITVPLYQYEFDAYLSFTYNVGVGAFCKSTLVKKLNAQDYAGACKELLKWDKVGNKQLAGLTKRRQAEYFTCIGQ